MRHMTRLLCLMLLFSLITFSCPLAEETDAPTGTPASTPIPADSGEAGFDFSQVDNPLATPVAVNPIDMPTPTPTPAPNYAYETYKNDSMGISFDIPYTWLLNPATNQETTIQFVEPKSERMDGGGRLSAPPDRRKIFRRSVTDRFRRADAA